MPIRWNRDRTAMAKEHTVAGCCSAADCNCLLIARSVKPEVTERPGSPIPYLLESASLPVSIPCAALLLATLDICPHNCILFPKRTSSYSGESATLFIYVAILVRYHVSASAIPISTNIRQVQLTQRHSRREGRLSSEILGGIHDPSRALNRVSGAEEGSESGQRGRVTGDLERRLGG